MIRFQTVLEKLKFTGVLEAISFILLLGIAMPLKYIWDWPHAVRWIGMAHGILWMAYIFLAILSQTTYRWSPKITLYLIIASLLPLGPIIADKKLLQNLPKTNGQANHP